MRVRLALGLFAAVLIAAATLIWLAIGNHQEKLLQARVHLDRGINLYHQKAYQEAEAELLQVVPDDPDEWKAPFYLGTIQIEQKRYEMAVPYLERAMRLNPKEPKILNALGVVYYKLGRLDMAQGYFWASLDLDPGNSNARGLMESMAKLQRRSAQAASAQR